MATVKLLQKPVRKLPEGLPEIQDRIEYLRCVLGYPIKKFAKRVGFSENGYLKIVERDEIKTGWFFKLIEAIAVIFNVDKNWIVTGSGSPYGRKDYSEYMFSAVKEDNSNDRTQLGRRFKQVREDRGQTQAAFAGSLEISTDVIAKVEIGKIYPSIATLNKVIKKYGVLDPWLLRGEGNRYPVPNRK